MSFDLKKSRKLGDFGSKFLFGKYECSAETLLPTATMHGLPNTFTALWATVDDEDGNSYCICREMCAHLTSQPWVMSNIAKAGMLIMPESRAQWAGGMVMEQNGNRIEWKSTDSYQGVKPAYRLLYDDGNVEYSETDFVQLTARAEAPGYQWYDPMYRQSQATQVFPAKGTIAGKKVTGWLALNSHYYQSGINYRNSPMVRDGQMITWFDCGNLYEDGSWEQGVVVVGRDGYSAVWFTDDKGQYTYSYDIDAEFDRDEDGYATEMRFSYFDARSGQPMKWIWRPKPYTKMLDLPKLAPHLSNKLVSEGVCMRADEKRTLRHGGAWPDFLSDDRIEKFYAEQQQNVPPGYI